MSELTFLGEREARRECEQILETLGGISRTELYLGTSLSSLLFSRFSQGIEKRKNRFPLAYFLGKAFFWEDEFEVEEGVFIPRSETEILIESFLKQSGFQPLDGFHFLDLGTGSGNIAATMAKLFPKAHGTASDLSEKALRVAKRNANRLGVGERIKGIRADGLKSFAPESFDAILSNPPYIASPDWAGLEPEVHREPRLALDGGKEGLDFYQKIMRELAGLKRGGSLWVEIGWGQCEAVQSLFEKKGFRSVRIFKDFNGIERVVTGIFNG